MAEGKRNVCVLGAGIIGMTTAYMIKEKYSDWDVTIIADKFNDQTLSYIAAGIFRPSTSFSGPTPEITKFVGLSFSLPSPYLCSLIL
jgi:D-aspartate oxidase